MSTSLDAEYAKRWVLSCRSEAESAKSTRMKLNNDNCKAYQLDHDFSHKRKGQSKEVLSKVRNATEQSKSFFQQALADLDDWWRCTTRSGGPTDGMKIKPEEIEKLTNYMLKQADYFSHVGISCQSGLLGSLAISNVGGCMVAKPKYKTKEQGKGKNYQKHVVLIEDKSWELRFDNIRQEDYFPDPTPKSGLYKIYECEMDLFLVKQLAEGEDAIYDMKAVEQINPWPNVDEKESERRDETGQDIPTRGMRPRVKITEFQGNLIDESTGDVLAENVFITLANDEIVIRKPTPNPCWHQKSTIVAAALIEVANSVWGVAMMDAGTKHNSTLTELFNLILDSSMKAVWGVNQVRIENLEDPKQITDGIPWGTNLKVNSSLPPGAKVMEEVITGQIPSDVINVFNLLTQETNTSMFTNDLRMGGQSMRAVKATEVVASENSITGVFQGIAKNFEEKKIQPELDLAWKTIAQNWDRIDPQIFAALFDERRGMELSQMSPQDVFVETVNSYKFEVFGISLTLRRQSDYKKWISLLQVIGGSEVLIEAFLQKYSFEKFLAEVMTALDINKTKIENTDGGGAPAQPQGAAPEQPGAMPGASPDMTSQQAAPQSQSPLAQVFANAGTGA